MNSEKIKAMKVKRRKKPSRGSDCSDPENGATQPLRKINNMSNSIHPIADGELKKKNSLLNRNSNPKIRLSQLPHIDSSSEDELGMRETMNPNKELSHSRESIGNPTRLQEIITMPVD
jgi:hypothetical protein